MQELRSRLTAADSANRILARQEREAYEQAQAARAEAQRARDTLTPAAVEIRCTHVCVCVCGCRPHSMRRPGVAWHSPSLASLGAAPAASWQLMVECCLHPNNRHMYPAAPVVAVSHHEWLFLLSHTSLLTPPVSHHLPSRLSLPLPVLLLLLQRPETAGGARPPREAARRPARRPL